MNPFADVISIAKTCEQLAAPVPLRKSRIVEALDGLARKRWHDNPRSTYSACYCEVLSTTDGEALYYAYTNALPD